LQQQQLLLLHWQRHHTLRLVVRLDTTLWLHHAYVSIRQHTSAYVSIRQHTSAYAAADLMRHYGYIYRYTYRVSLRGGRGAYKTTCMRTYTQSSMRTHI
jgi:hypothetical protein